MREQINSPEIGISEDDLKTKGFTNSGAPKFIDTVKSYSTVLFEKSVHLGEVDRAANFPLEITHDHVRQAAHSIANTYGKPIKPKWVIFSQISEYILTAFVGLSANHLDKPFGIAGFGLGILIVGILIVTRLTKDRSEQ